MTINRILITGCQRSGTTLMGLILDSHHKIQHTDEDSFNINSLEENTKFIHSYKLPQEAVNFPFITQQLKPDKIIWMVRNPFDVTRSMLNLHIKRNRTSTEPWAATFAHKEINKALQYLPYSTTQEIMDTIEEYRKTLSQMSYRDTSNGMIIAAATCWSIKQLALKEYKRLNLDFKVIHYEDLVTHPEVILKDCCDFLNIEWNENLLKHHELHKGSSIGNTKNDRAIDSSGVFSHKGFFNKSELKLIDNLTSKIADKYHYINGESTQNIEIREEDLIDHVNKGNKIDFKIFNYYLHSHSRCKDSEAIIKLIKPFVTSEKIEVTLEPLAYVLCADWFIRDLSKNKNVDISLKILSNIEKNDIDLHNKLLTLLKSKNIQYEIYAISKCEEMKLNIERLLDIKFITHPTIACSLITLIKRSNGDPKTTINSGVLDSLLEKFPDNISIQRTLEKEFPSLSESTKL